MKKNGVNLVGMRELAQANRRKLARFVEMENVIDLDAAIIVIGGKRYRLVEEKKNKKRKAAESS